MMGNKNWPVLQTEERALTRQLDIRASGEYAINRALVSTSALLLVACW